MKFNQKKKKKKSNRTNDNMGKMENEENFGSIVM